MSSPSIRVRLSQWFRGDRRCVRPIAALIAVVVVGSLISAGQLMRIRANQLDAAGFAELIERDAPNVALSSTYLYSVYPYLWPPDRSLDSGVCAFVTGAGTESVSMWPIHPYVAAIPLGVAARITGVRGSTLGSLAIGFSVAGGLIGGFCFLIARRVRKEFALGWLALIAAWPVLTHGLLGQPYFDRIFFGPACLLPLAVERAIAGSRRAGATAVALVIAGALVSERAALMIGFAAVSLPLLLGGVRTRRSRSCLAVQAAGLLALTWALVWQTALQESPYYGTIDASSVHAALSRLAHDPARGQALFLVVMLLPVLIVISFRWRLLLLAAAMVFPNLAVTVGGAELSGLSTHYHQMYLPVLAGLAAVALVRIDELAGKGLSKVPGTVRRLCALVSVAGAVAGSVAIWASALPDQRQAALAPTVRHAFGWYHHHERESLQADIRAREDLAVFASTQGDTVSAGEGEAVSLLLAGVRGFRYLPLGIGSSDVVIARYVGESVDPTLFPYGRPGWAEADVEGCVREVLATRYRTARVVESGGSRVVVYVLRKEFRAAVS